MGVCGQVWGLKDKLQVTVRSSCHTTGTADKNMRQNNNEAHECVWRALHLWEQCQRSPCQLQQQGHHGGKHSDAHHRQHMVVYGVRGEGDGLEREQDERYYGKLYGI